MALTSDQAERRVIVMQEDFLNCLSKSNDYKVYFIKLRHPRARTCALFAISAEIANPHLFEVVKFSGNPRSWFIDEIVEEDGGLYMATPIDPLFLILPYMLKQKFFCPLKDVVQDEEYRHTLCLVNFCELDQLRLICDEKDVDGQKIWRCNNDKVLAWLRCKVKRLASALSKKADGNRSSCSMGYRAAGFNVDRCENGDSKKLHDDQMKDALNLILEYVPAQLQVLLRDSLGLGEINKEEGEKSALPRKSGKRKSRDAVEPNEDYMSVLNEFKFSKQPKLTAAQKKLAKVDKTGMKALSSFFQKKSSNE